MVNDYAVVTVRNSSTRLPGKAISEVAPGLTSIEAVIERAKLTGYPVLIATSTDPTDNIFEEIAKRRGVEIFRGALLNKIKRWKDAFEKHRIKNALLVDGDDLMYDFEIGKRAMLQLHQTDALMIRHPENIMCGYFTYAVKKEAIDAVYEFAQAENTNTDVITEFVNKSGIKIDSIDLFEWEKDKPYRLTLDYIDDLAFFTELIKNVGIEADGKTVTLFLDNHPEIVKLNQHRQTDWANNQKKFNEAVTF